MFDTKTSITARLTDTVDLLIDFATLGEYGLEEPAGRAAPSCEARRRTAPTGTSLRRRAGDPSPGTPPRRTRIEGPFLLRP